MAPLRIGIVGASGETGKSIVEGLLKESGDVHLIALTRPASLDKPANKSLASRGVELRGLDTSGSHEDLVAALKDIEILISAIAPLDQLAQIPLATAAKEAGVRRFFPCAAVSVIPAGDVHLLRDEKEKVYQHVKKIGLGYTIVDVGWWYQISWPRVPSGKLDSYSFMPTGKITGTGDVPSALTDLRDIGRYFAKLVRDERSENQYVLVYNELWTQHQIWDAVSRISGEDITKSYQSASELESNIAAAKEKMAGTANPDQASIFQLIVNQYPYSWGVRGDNTPEYARFLGYVTSKDLYPEMGFVGFEEYLKELLEGKVEGVYEEKRAEMEKVFKAAKG